jgi:hypothetical protein
MISDINQDSFLTLVRLEEARDFPVRCAIAFPKPFSSDEPSQLPLVELQLLQPSSIFQSTLMMG